MPILNIKQPEYIIVSDSIRLRKFDNNFAFALEWYQDEETLMLVDGENEPYDMEKLCRMYSYLNEHGELYFIEIEDGDKYITIGDVTFSNIDMPIVIGVETYRGKGIGKKVVEALIQRGKQLGYSYLAVNEIYKYNIGSQKLFESIGFQRYEETESSYRYKLNLI
ncbi:GNAT family protein [Schnuerera sp.]|uniref:GNAT family N-acetyltransferase n=1 Tax=Schnuerera sp. TaxID=2794844 RepID=UPI002C921D0D|nr:GNAT family protein [Schnuerera sp.]HSH34801.1 GNAT family protein [Schnuerera sp.]